MQADLAIAGSVPAVAADLSHGRISSLPILLLNVHEHCNCRCLMCDIWKRKDGRELDLADFARHRESLRRIGVRNVVLTGGEPLLHSDFEGLCAFLRSCDVRITLLTTGLLVARRAAILAHAVDEIIVSLDGPEEIHDRVRRVKGAYQLIAMGIREVTRINSGVAFHGRCTVQKANHSRLRQTVSAAKALSLASISFLAADASSQAFNRELVWPGGRQSEIMLARQEITALEAEVEALVVENAADIHTRFVRESESRLRRIIRRFREHLGELAPVAPLCNAPWVSAVFEVDGSIRPCFFHPKFGDTHAASLEQALNGDEAILFRSSLKVSDDPICRRCVCSLNYAPA
jgi:MoaA/NifB/PqqE/SkfB family radical SAM enzyme